MAVCEGWQHWTFPVVLGLEMSLEIDETHLDLCKAACCVLGLVQCLCQSSTFRGGKRSTNSLLCGSGASSIRAIIVKPLLEGLDKVLGDSAEAYTGATEFTGQARDAVVSILTRLGESTELLIRQLSTEEPELFDGTLLSNSINDEPGVESTSSPSFFCFTAEVDSWNDVSNHSFALQQWATSFAATGGVRGSYRHQLQCSS